MRKRRKVETAPTQGRNSGQSDRVAVRNDGRQYTRKAESEKGNHKKRKISSFKPGNEHGLEQLHKKNRRGEDPKV